MKLTLGFSPCPNDTFIFDTEGLEFAYSLADVEELNRRAFSGSVDITKMSCSAYAYAAKNYLILDSGSALGHGNGPLLVSRKKIDQSKIAGSRIAIPGRYTTANLLFSLAWPEAVNKSEYVFSDITDVLLKDEADLGLIIHETRFTYHAKGLVMIADLGKYWEDLTGLPIPLGIIVINRKIPADTALRVNRIIRRSLEYANSNPVASWDFVKSNAEETDNTVIKNHIELYVNKYTLNLGLDGKRAITELFRVGCEKGVLPGLPEQIFLTV
jgi:1,4-dihydroxy-6-naphthoate synthase